LDSVSATGYEILHYEIHELVYWIRNKEALPHSLMGIMIASIYKKDDKTSM
jgi:hypothetical protein